MENLNEFLSTSHRGVGINVYYDSCYDNPFTSWDCEMPTMVYAGGRFGCDDYSNGDITDYLLSKLSYGQVKLHQKKICSMMDEEWILEDEYDSVDDKYDTIIDTLERWLTDPEHCGKFCEEFKIPHYFGISRGYSQGDWAEVFVCWTPEYGQISGVDESRVTQESLQGTFDLYSAWAWGDVYRIECDEVDERCSGFYGDDEVNGYIQEVKCMIDRKIKEDVGGYINKAKTLCKHRVPLHERELLLTEYKKTLIKPAQEQI